MGVRGHGSVPSAERWKMERTAEKETEPNSAASNTVRSRVDLSRLWSAIMVVLCIEKVKRPFPSVHGFKVVWKAAHSQTQTAVYRTVYAGGRVRFLVQLAGARCDTCRLKAVEPTRTTKLERKRQRKRPTLQPSMCCADGPSVP